MSRDIDQPGSVDVGAMSKCDLVTTVTVASCAPC